MIHHPAYLLFCKFFKGELGGTSGTPSRPGTLKTQCDYHTTIVRRKKKSHVGASSALILALSVTRESRKMSQPNSASYRAGNTTKCTGAASAAHASNSLNVADTSDSLGVEFSSESIQTGQHGLP